MPVYPGAFSHMPNAERTAPATRKDRRRPRCGAMSLSPAGAHAVWGARWVQRYARAGWSAGRADHAPHFVGGEGAQRGRADVALTSDRQQSSGERLIVGRLHDAHDVVDTEGAIDVRKFAQPHP